MNLCLPGRCRVLLAGLLLLGGAAVCAGQTTKEAREARFKAEIQPLVQKYCFDCHGNGSAEGDFSLEKYTSAQAALEGRKNWLKVLRRMHQSDMPPLDHDARPTKEEYAKLAAAVDRLVNELDCSAPVAGHVTLRRLTRYEYRNTVRDLVGVDYQPALAFPADEVGYGFDNIGDVLSLPPLLLEKYLAAAEEITQQAILTEAPKPKTVAEVRGSRLQGDGGSGDRGERVFSDNGEASTEIEIPTEGKYLLTVMARADQAGDEPAKMALKHGGEELQVFEVKNEVTREEYKHERQLSRGKHKLTVAFTNDFYMPDAEEGRRDRNLKVLKIEVYGPILGGNDHYPEMHRRIVKVVPGDNLSWHDAAKTNLRDFATRAFRRPAKEEEVERLAKIVEIAKENGDNFETGMQLAVQAILASPHFLYKVEASPDASAGPDAVRKLNDYELAVRLSYFLWSTMPDEELTRLAGEGKLKNNDVLEQQVRRMLKDDRAMALVENFATQWLTLRNLDNAQPSSRRFRQWNNDLRSAMRKETELFIREIIREDMSLLTLLNADFTFVNEPLAKLYGIPDVQGNEFRKVSLAGTNRGGLLTQASILTVTSNPTRTSPVKRGKWILENLLNEPPPPPPPDVPELKEERSFEISGTLRERMKQHRADPVCNSCHQVMDSLGFALENYDPIGSYREKEGSFAIDPLGELPSGEKFTGPTELRQLLLSTKKKEFLGCAVEKTLTYALGRGLEYYDLCEVERIRSALEKNDHRFSTLVVEIVRSHPFQHQGVKRSE